MSQTEVQLIKDAVIVNADVSNSAAIDVSKISGVMPLAGGTFTDDVTFTGASANVVFDKSANAFEFADNAKAIFGTGSDLSIYHDGTDSFISNLTGGLKILGDTIRLKGKSVDENMLVASANGAVELYHDNSKKFETFASGVRAANDGHIKTASDSGKFMAGASDDLQLFHDGSNSFLTNTSSGGFLHIRSVSGINLQDEGGNENFLKCIDNGAVEIYHDNSKKFETTANGASITGKLDLSDNLDMPDNAKIIVGTGDDLKIYHDGSQSYITNATSDLRIRSGYVKLQGANSENMLVGNQNTSVELYYDGSKKFETTSEGIQVTSSGIPSVVVKSTGSNRADVRILAQGTGHAYLWMDASNGDLSGADYAFFVHKNDTLDLELGNYANDIILKTRNGSLGSGGLNTAIHCHENGAVELYHDGTKFFETGSTANFARTIAPSTNGGFDLGLNATRWRHIRTVDNGKIMIGNSDDLQLYHDGTDSIIQGGDPTVIRSNLLLLKNFDNSESYIRCYNNGAVELYHDNSKKFETKSSGVGVTGNLEVGSGQITCGVHGTTGFQIINDGTFGTLHSVDLTLRTASTTRATIDTSGNFNIPNDTGRIRLGNSNDLQIYHDGNNSVIAAGGVGDLQLFANADDILLQAVDNIFIKPQSGESGVTVLGNGSVSLFYDNSEKLYTTADGIESKGELHFKSPSNFNGEQTGRIEWWNENDAGVMAKIGVDRKSSTGAPADLVFSTSQNVDTSANGSDGDITERGRFTNNGLRLTNQPCFYAYSNVTRNNYGGGIVVAYTATHHNQGNHYSTSTYRFTAPVDGIYVFGGNPGYVESGQTYSLYLRINGAVRTEVGRVVQGNFPSHSQFGFSVSVKLSANDYVDLYQLGRMHHNAAYSAWWGYFLG